MPPQTKDSNTDTPAFDPVDHLLPPPRPHSSVGPTAGIIIILIVLIIGAIFSWIENSNRPNPNENLPFIPGDVTTDTVAQ